MTNKTEQIDHPTHYNSHPSGVESIDVVEHFSFNVGNAIKYLWRAGLKVQPEDLTDEALIRDLEKALWYMKREVERNKKEQGISKPRKIVMKDGEAVFEDTISTPNEAHDVSLRHPNVLLDIARAERLNNVVTELKDLSGDYGEFTIHRSSDGIIYKMIRKPADTLVWSTLDTSYGWSREQVLWFLDERSLDGPDVSADYEWGTVMRLDDGCAYAVTNPNGVVLMSPTGRKEWSRRQVNKWVIENGDGIKKPKQELVISNGARLKDGSPATLRYLGVKGNKYVRIIDDTDGEAVEDWFPDEDGCKASFTDEESTWLHPALYERCREFYEAKKKAE